MDILYSESFIEELYGLFIHSFNEFGYATFDFVLVASLIKKIHVQYSYNSMPTLGGFQIVVMDFTKNNKEEFVATVRRKAIGFDNYYWNVSDNKFKYILTVVGLIESFTIIQNHTEDVLRCLDDLDSDKYILAPTIDNWKTKCDSITKELFLQIATTCKLLSDYLKTSEQKGFLQEFNDLTISYNNIDNLFLNLIVNKDILGDGFSFDSYKDSFTNIIDILLAE